MEIHLAAAEHPTYCHYSSEDHTRVASRKGPDPVSVGLASSWGRIVGERDVARIQCSKEAQSD